MTQPTDNRGGTLRIDGDWLVDDLGKHTCAGGTPESGYAHEPSCGLEPLMKVADLVALFDVLTELGLPINRPDELRKHIAKVKTEAGEAALAPFHALFAGDPDTPCRTTWRPSLPGPGIHRPPSTECVEVPSADLNAAFDEAQRVIEGQP